MIGTAIAGPLEKINKVRQPLADEASEQRGSYSKVIRAGQDQQPRKDTRSREPESVSSKGELQWLWVS